MFRSRSARLFRSPSARIYSTPSAGGMAVYRSAGSGCGGKVEAMTAELEGKNVYQLSESSEYSSSGRAGRRGGRRGGLVRYLLGRGRAGCRGRGRFDGAEMGGQGNLPDVFSRVHVSEYDWMADVSSFFRCRVCSW